MKTVIWPRTDGDLILDFREVQSDGNTLPALVAVDSTGTIRSLGKIIEVRDGGGHVELTRFVVDGALGFSRNAAQEVMIHPEGI